jgi:tripeptidyl-peptidase-2
MQVDKIFEYCERFGGVVDDADIRYRVTIPSRGAKVHGLYLRDQHETSKPMQVALAVTPLFKEPTSKSGEEVSDEEKRLVNVKKCSFQKRFSVSCEADWISFPKHLLVLADGKGFEIVVDPTKLPTGSHTVDIVGHDEACPEQGPMWRCPVTVIRAEPVVSPPHYKFLQQPFSAGAIQRKFVTVPAGATYAEFKLKAGTIDTSRRFVLHCVYLKKNMAYSQTESQTWKAFKDDEELVVNMAVEAGATLEVCVAQAWNSLGDTTMDLSVKFHSLLPDCKTITLGPDEPIGRLGITSHLQSETLQPTGTLSKLCRTLAPSEHKIRPLDQVRDILPGGLQVFELVLTYNWEAEEKGKMTCRVPLLNNMLYEAVFGSQLWMLYDGNKRLLGAGDCWPEAVSVPKGKCVLRLQVRGPKAELEKIAELSATVEYALAKDISIAIHPSRHAAIASGPKFKEGTLLAGARVPLFLVAPPTKFLPSFAKIGDVLTGSLCLKKLTGINAGPNDHVPERLAANTFPLRCVVGPKVDAKNKKKGEGVSSDATKEKDTEVDASADTAKDVDEDTKVDKEPDKGEQAADGEGKKDNENDEVKLKKDIADELRALSIQYLSKLAGPKAEQAMAHILPGLLEQDAGHLPLLHLVLSHKMKLNKSGKDPAELGAVISAADDLMKAVKSDELAAHFGRRLPADDEASAKERKEQEKIKKMLVEALVAKAEAIMSLFELDPKMGLLSTFKSTKIELERWVELGKKEHKNKYLGILIFSDVQDGRSAIALKTLLDAVKETNDDKAVLERKAKLLDQLGWTEWAQNERDWLLVKFPLEYQPF